MTLVVADGVSGESQAQQVLRIGVTRPHRPHRLKLYLIGLDAVAIAIAIGAASVISRTFHPFGSQGARPDGASSLLIALICLPLWLGVFARYGLYKARRVSSRIDEVGALVHATVISTVIMAAVSFLLKEPVSRAWLILCLPISFATCLIERETVRGVFRSLRRSGQMLRRVVVVGANREAQSLCELLSAPELGYQVVGVVDDSDIVQLGKVPNLGPVANTREVVRAVGATGVLVATTAISAATSNWLVRGLIDDGVHVEMSSSLRGIVAGRLRIRCLGTTPVVYVEPVRRGGWRAVAKRSFDIVGAAVGLALFSPLLAFVAAAIKLDSKGPVFFSQIRIGRMGRPFRMLKFRSMVPNADALLSGLADMNEADGPLFKIRNDPRVTRVGRVLRRLSVDELPQLVNVLRGEMSLVGPRPALVAEMEEWLPELNGRLQVRPGLTGMWQVSGRSNLSFAEYVRHDMYYVENWSLWCDVAILAKTIPVLLSKRGAY